MSDAWLHVGTPVLSLLDHGALHRNDVGLTAGPCDDAIAHDAAQRVLINFNHKSYALLKEVQCKLITWCKDRKVASLIPFGISFQSAMSASYSGRAAVWTPATGQTHYTVTSLVTSLVTHCGASNASLA